MARIKKVEKVILATSDPDKYTAYRCEEHGVFAQRKDCDTGICSYCKKQCEPIPNARELREKYREELGWN